MRSQGARRENNRINAHVPHRLSRRSASMQTARKKPVSFLALHGLAFYGIGLLGFTPLLTCYAFLGNANEARRQAHRIQRNWAVWLLFLLGVILAVAIPILIYWTLGSWIEILLRLAPRPHAWWKGDFFGINR